MTTTIRAWDLKPGQRVRKSENGPARAVCHVGTKVDGHLAIFFVGVEDVWWAPENRDVEVEE